MKRLIDIVVALFGLIVLAPIIIPVMFLVWLQDRHSPFYVAARAAKNSGEFRMVKLRSMIKNADRTGVDSTSSNDARITPVGAFIRKYKLDEVVQLWNVLLGDMSLVGPRPNVIRETNLYTSQEQRLLSVKPGITDYASIVFSDEGNILDGSSDPDICYHQLIRPGKSKLGLFYVDNHGTLSDLVIIALTVIAIVNKRAALNGIVTVLRSKSASAELIEIATRRSPLVPTPPPGASEIVTSRGGEVIG